MHVKLCAQSDNENGHDTGTAALLKCCSTSTETVGLLGTGAQVVYLDFHTAPELWVRALCEKGINYSSAGGNNSYYYRRSTVAHKHHTSVHNTAVLNPNKPEVWAA